MAVVGHAAASLNVFLDIPIVLRGMSQSMYRKSGPMMQVSNLLWLQIDQVEPNDPTRIKNEYYGDWWNLWKEWTTKTLQVEVDYIATFQWHLNKVNKKFAFRLC